MSSRLLIEFLGLDMVSGAAAQAARSIRELEYAANTANSGMLRNHISTQSSMSEQTKYWARQRLSYAEEYGRLEVEAASQNARLLINAMEERNSVMLANFRQAQRMELEEFRTVLTQELNAQKIFGTERKAIMTEVLGNFKVTQAEELAAFKHTQQDELAALRSTNAQSVAMARTNAEQRMAAERMYVNQYLDAERAKNEQAAAMAREQQAGGGIGQGLMGAGMMSLIGGAMTLFATAGIDKILLNAADAAAKFDSDLVLLVNHANVVATEIPRISQALRDMAVGVATGPDALNEAMFRVESHMTSLPPKLQNTATALDILNNSAKLAKIGHADLEQTTIAVTNAMAAYGAQNYTASQIAGIFNRAVGEGNMRLEDLVKGFATGLLPVAQQAGVRLESLTAAMATMTDMGIPVQRAATYIRSALIQMTMPSGPAEDALTAIGLGAEEAGQRMAGFSELLEKAGINQSELAVKMRQTGSLAETMQFLREKLQEAGASAGDADAILARAFGGIRSGTGVVTLYNNLGGLVQKEKDAMAAAKDFADVWKYYTEHDPTYSIDSLKAASENLQISLGQALIPVVIQLARSITPFLEDLRKWIDANPGLIQQIAVFGSAIGIITGLLLILAGVVLVIGGAIAAVGLPFIIVGAAVAGVALLILTHWQQFSTWWNNTIGPLFDRAKGLFDDLVRAGSLIFQYLVPNLQEGFRQIWAAMTGGPKDTGLSDFAKQANEFLHSYTMAGIIAFFMVLLPAAIQVSVGFLVVMVDVIRTGFNLLGHIITATMLMAKGDVVGATKEMAKGAQEFAADSLKMGQDIKTAWDTSVTATNTAMTSFEDARTRAYRALNGISTDTDNTVSHFDAKMEEMPGMVQRRMNAAAAAAHAGGVNLGAEMDAGMAAGLSQNAILLEAAARAVVGQAIAAGQGAAVVASPSQATAQMIGQPMAAGIAMGINSGAGIVNQAITNVIGGSMGNGDNDFSLPLPLDWMDQPESSPPDSGDSSSPADGGGGSNAEEIAVLRQILANLQELVAQGVREGYIDTASLLYQAQESATFQRMRGIRGVSS